LDPGGDFSYWAWMPSDLARDGDTERARRAALPGDGGEVGEKMSEEPLLLTEAQAAEKLNMSVRTFRRENIPSIKFRRDNAKMKRWHIEDIKAWYPSVSSKENTDSQTEPKPSPRRGTRKSGSATHARPISETLGLLQGVKRRA
jgi:hypothetical protein